METILLTLSLVGILPEHKKALLVPQKSDRWWGQDKAYHLGVSIFIAQGIHILASKKDTETETIVTAIGITISIGLVKESYDWLTKKHFSWKDLVYDGCGAMIGGIFP